MVAVPSVLCARRLLFAALDALTGRPLGRLLNEITLWGVGESHQLLLTVDTTVGVRLSSRILYVESFTDLDNTSITAAVRHIINELIHHHHRALVAALDHVAQQADRGLSGSHR
ncbi:hypothetical protein [Nocardia sp. CNY236]|uniref:hypothetical protein n=1 Tax=Nocardia sp. CNY236 TaxID=1169152 RepID=UPI000411AC38|nr:hypothetical protein [Nocardia sp. CNY236]